MIGKVLIALLIHDLLFIILRTLIERREENKDIYRESYSEKLKRAMEEQRKKMEDNDHTKPGKKA